MKNILISLGITAIMFVTAGPASADVDFLVPGVSLHSVDFTAGTSVSYLIVSEAHGIKDTSLVILEVTGKEAGGAGLEISSTSWPPVDLETITVRLTLCPGAGEIDTPEEFYACISDILVRDGTEPFREPSLEELEELISGGFSSSATRGFSARNSSRRVSRCLPALSAAMSTNISGVRGAM